MSDEITDRLFPVPPERLPEAPIPLQPSIRAEFLAHRRHIDLEITMLRESFQDALRQPPELSPASARRRVQGAALRAGKVIVMLTAGLGVLAEAAKLWRPELVGPLDTLRQLLGGM